MIRNKDRYPDAEWLPESKQRVIGTVGSSNLVLLGFEPGFTAGQKMPLIATSSASDFLAEDLHAAPLSSLLTMVQDPVNITEPLESAS